jgi:GntR family transcriptional regulator
MSLAEQVVADLRAAIRDHAFGVNGQLPSEPDLSRQLGVSRPTIRQAIAVLEQEGYVSRRQGHGTFVISSVVALPDLLNVNHGVTEMIRAAGQEPGTSRTVISEGVADSRIGERLSVDEGASVVVIERSRTADGRPVAVTRDYFSVDELLAHGVPVGKLKDFAEAHDSLYASLADAGLAVTYGIAKVLPSRATPELATELGLKEDDDLLLLEQTDFADTGKPVLFSEEYLIPGPLAVYVFRRGPG